ncbi:MULTISPECIES: hypothetical protein [unclassified Gemella]|uniref:hypothetical protein n=1 Tax=unclassified Gemella TaxID=2624949 RepID=UPI001073E289|nr:MULTISPECIES: hypothetical protein [unclassified Gemella]MBF0709733.1 hypothetical protein [Gemella sp. GL1.1]MBF0747250.1 hypothetical protein [Gemella sp. 19428wG2_WT2a]NYS27077.1 hypothetical protein [Gemella sp. GL1]TFU57836.1 hypothetical protein E4T67_06225 [Gemella sp. WT2a]
MYNPEIAQLILDESKRSVPKGQAHDFALPDYDQQDFKDTAEHLIANGSISAEFEYFYEYNLRFIH